VGAAIDILYYQRQGAAALLVGAIARLGSRYVTGSKKKAVANMTNPFHFGRG
jgi:hypothetical protein